MQDRKLDRLFERFRAKGDVAALGEVFDRTSPELLRVAMFLARSPAEAEDLLQATFLTAIERAGRYDGSRSLVPWLLGILVNHAHELRRARGRALDPERLERPSPAGPHEALEAQELGTELERALLRLPARDRAILEPFLGQGRSPIEIAREHGLAPGTVRMQLHRGLARLRELLPAGLALGTAVMMTGGRGLAAVRASVLRSGSELAPRLAAAGAVAAPSMIVGGILVTKKAVLVVLSVALVGGLVWFARGGGDEAREGAGLAAPAVAATIESPAQPPPARVEPAVAPEEKAEPARVPVRDQPGAAPSAFEAALSGVTGRLVEPDGRPAADQDVLLLEFHLEEARAWLGAEPAVLGAQRHEDLERRLELEVDRDRTDSDGRFLLRGARTQALHALGGTATSPRVPLRLIAEPLAPGTVVDLGDVVLAQRAALRGRVVDEGGAPVEQARIRAGALPDGIFPLGLADLQPECALALSISSPPLVLTLPSWIARLEDDLGLAVAFTDEEGRFELGDVTAGAPDVLIDHAGFLTSVLQNVPLEAGSAHDFGFLTLERGLTLRGRVLEADGTPIVSAQVFAGALPVEERNPFQVWIGGVSTDAQGRFEIQGLSPTEVLAVAARPDGWSPWIVQPWPGQEGGECELRAGARGTLTIHVQDELGQPVGGAVLKLNPDPRLLKLFTGFVRVLELGERAREPSPGTFVIASLTQGTYDCSVSAKGFAVGHVLAQLDGPAEEVTLVLAPARTMRTRVLDAATSAPIAAATVSLAARSWNGMAMASARSDASGLANLDVRRRGGLDPEELCLRADHPGYAPAFLLDPAEAAVTELRLSAGGALHAQLAPPPGDREPFLLTLWLVESAAGWRPEDLQVLRLDARGEGRLTHLTSGRWHYELVEGWGRDASLLALLDPEHQPEDIERGDFEIREGQTTELEIRHEDAQSESVGLGAGTATVEGRILIDGAPAQGLTVSLQGEGIEKLESVELAADGSFQFLAAPAGQVVLAVETRRHGKRYMTDPTLSRDFVLQLEPGQVQRLDFDWTTTAVEIRVLDPRGEPAPDVPLSILGVSNNVSIWTDRSGRAAFPLLGSGAFRVQARHAEHGIGQAQFEVKEGEPLEPITIRLSSGVPCAGHVRIDGAPEQGTAGLAFRGRRGSGVVSAQIELADGRGDFRVVGLEPGKYLVYLYGFETDFGLVEMELGPSGDESLELVFRPE